MQALVYVAAICEDVCMMYGRILTSKLKKLQSIADNVAPRSPPQASTCLMVCYCAFFLNLFSSAVLYY